MLSSEKPMKKFMPKWDEIMRILATPKQEVVYANRSLDPSTWDGAWDYQAAQRGLGMRKVTADIGKQRGEKDIPAGFVFVCHCGYARRVVDSEHAFTCERDNGAGSKGCGIIWQKEVELSDEMNANGKPVWKAKLEERDCPSGRKYMMPIITGYLIGEWRKKQYEERRKAGLQIDPEPQVPMPTIIPDTGKESE